MVVLESIWFWFWSTKRQFNASYLWIQSHRKCIFL